MQPRNFVRIVLEVEPELAARVAQWAQQHDMTRKQLIVAALEEYFARHSKGE